MDYVVTARINRAKPLLQESNLSIKTIAEQTGFKTPYYFSRMFKARTGFSPSQYRRIAILH